MLLVLLLLLQELLLLPLLFLLNLLLVVLLPVHSARNMQKMKSIASMARENRDVQRCPGSIGIVWSASVVL